MKTCEKFETEMKAGRTCAFIFSRSATMEARKGKAWSRSALDLAALALSNQVSSSESRSTLVPETKSSIDKRTLDTPVSGSFALVSGSLMTQFRFKIREHFRCGENMGKETK